MHYATQNLICQIVSINRFLLIFSSFLVFVQQHFIIGLIQNHLVKLDENRVGDTMYWKYLTFEILFLWSVLTSIQNDYLARIVNGKFSLENKFSHAHANACNNKIESVSTILLLLFDFGL